MYLGHGSWVALVFFGGVVAIRYLSSHRGDGHRGNPGQGRFLSESKRHRPGDGDVAASSVTRGTTAAGTPPGWFTDPFLTHEKRYWSGSEWTEHVTDGGVPGTDPPHGSD